jgi:hypothetical protein
VILDQCAGNILQRQRKSVRAPEPANAHRERSAQLFDRVGLVTGSNERPRPCRLPDTCDVEQRPVAKSGANQLEPNRQSIDNVACWY